MKYALVFIVLAVIVAGCNGETEQQSQETLPPEAPSAPDNQQTTPTQPQTATGVTGELTNLMRRQMQMNYNVDYEFNIVSDGVPAQDMKMTYYMQGTSRMRVDSIMQGLESRMYIVDNKYYSCTKMMDAWNCMDYTGLGTDMGEIRETADEETIADIERSVVTRLPPKTVAGVVSSCFRVQSDDSTIDYCYTPEGIPVYVRTEMDYDEKTMVSEMIATRISTSIPSGTFDLPVSATSYDDMDIADIMNQYGMP